jgi:hypothetical protein
VTRRRRGFDCLATTFLTLAALSACTQPDTGTTIPGPSSVVPLYFAASADGAFLVASSGAFTVAEPGAKAQAAECCTRSNLTGPSASSRNLFSGSVALDGTPWVVLGDGRVIDLKGREHVTASAVRQLERYVDLTIPARDGKPATTRSVSRHVQKSAVSVVDSTAVLAPTETNPGSTSWHSNDSVVYRVSASGAPVAVAGRPGFGTVRPVSGLVAGERVAATEVDLERVLALVALDQSSFVLVMIAPTTRPDAIKARLQAAVVTNGQISRLELPDLCALEDNVVASRISDHEVILSALKGAGGCRTPAYAWIRLDTAKNTFTEVGSGAGFAGIAGDQLLTATLKPGESSPPTVRWQDLPDHP